MKILCVCNQGNNRSVQLSHLLKYWGNDTIPIGTDNTTQETLDILCDWSDVIITTDRNQHSKLKTQDKIKFWPIEDVYPRPFNPELLPIAKDYLEQNKDWLKVKKD